MFESWSLNRKLLSAFGGVALVLGLVGGVAVYALEKTVRDFDHVADVNLANVVTLTKMRLAQKDVVIVESTLIGTVASQQEVASERARFESALKSYDEAKAIYLTIPFVEGEDEKWNKVDNTWKALADATRHILDLSASSKSEDHALRDKFAESEFEPVRKQSRQAFEDLTNFQENEGKKWSTAAKATASSGLAVVFGSVGIGFLLAFGLGLVLARSLSRAIGSVTGNLADGAGQVAAAAAQISASNESLSANGTEQAAALQETASSLDEVNAMVKRNAENASRSRDSARQTQEAAARGQGSVDAMLGAVEEMSRSNGEVMRQVEESNREISEIAKVIADIGNKTKVINDIVFQTKLLSFNASVEAARAGEHGKGFAVVAEEVGNLAQMSGNASKEISQMLEGSIRRVDAIVTETKSKVEALTTSGRVKAEQGSEMARRCSEVFGEIVSGIGQMNTMVGEIATASQEQARGVQEITRAVSEMDLVTQRNSIATQEAASAATELSAQAETLIGVVRTLEQTVHGANGAGHAPARAVVQRAPAAPRKLQVQPVQAAPAVGTEAEIAVPSKDRFRDVA